LLGDDPYNYSNRVRGFALVSGDEDLEVLWNDLFLLVGLSCLDSPPAQYQPSALPEILEKVKAVVLIHRDKHGPAIGIYAREAIKTEGRLESVCKDANALLVPFAVPPMLARWDRAISELKQDWSKTHDVPFPVPESSEPSDWQSRRRRDRRSRKSAKEKRAAENIELLTLDGNIDEFLVEESDEVTNRVIDEVIDESILVITEE
jgi:hypothetical protein